MMNMKKKMISLLLVLALVVGICPAAFAGEVDSTKGTEIYLGTWLIADSKDEDESIAPHYNEIPVSTVVKTKYASKRTVPEKQPQIGYSFPSYGGSVYIDTKGGASVNFDVSLGWEIADSVSIAISTGVAYSAPGVGGISVNVPASNHHYRIELKHNYRVELVRVDTYQYSQLIDSYNTIRKTLVSIDAYAVQMD